VGTTPGGGEVIHWTDKSDTSFERADLNLVAGEKYYIAVKAKNEGGLWSDLAVPGSVKAGSGECITNKKNVYLPLVLRKTGP
jgi:hypothetical protein